MTKYKYVDLDLNPFGFHEVEVEIEKIKRHPNNPRKISKRDQNELNTSISKFGLIDKPIVNADFGLIAGHQRLDLLEQKKVKVVKVQIPEIPLTDEQVLELLVRHNKNQGEWDFDKLAQFNAEQLVGFGFDYAELDKIIQGDKEEAEAELTEPEYPITPRMSEKHSYVIIMVDNEIEKANMETILNLQVMKDYKSSKIGTGRVITFQHLKDAMDKYSVKVNTPSGETKSTKNQDKK